ncbi:cytochrome P450 71D9 isoform X2 [Morus notabilis]|uniref:cytochrome P450 71D9 isoform X2 n=1 Tax=Morus notabilis TaxID=981085 RepID=UPI000CECFAC9|nr:cytochrome P450 71D9 isoform X2 [Morus notabilis]
MELKLPSFSILFTFFVFVFMVLNILIKRAKTISSDSKLPPGPWKLPLLGNIHQLFGSLPHRALRDLAKKHGPFIYLRLGQLSTLVVSSTEYAKEVMRTHDVIFASRPRSLFAQILLYDCTDVAFAPYGEYWRQLRKICMQELLSTTRVESFRPIREEEMFNLMEWIASNTGSAINLTEKIKYSSYSITSRAAFGKKSEHHDEFISIVEEAIKDVFSAGSETSATAVDWAMVEMIKNPKVMKKAQNEVRQVFSRKGSVDETVLSEMKYLKCIVKETLRLHPPAPLLVPRECREKCEINGYEIPAKTQVIVNAWAIGRDPKYWTEPESFIPERFLDSSIDYKGTNFEYIPFGAGRRICPGMSFGLINVELPLAMFLYHFDWRLPNGMKHEDLNMTELFGVTVRRKDDLYLIPITYDLSPIGKISRSTK